MAGVTKKSLQLANTRVEGCEPTGASKAGLDFWQRVKEWKIVDGVGVPEGWVAKTAIARDLQSQW